MSECKQIEMIEVSDIVDQVINKIKECIDKKVGKQKNYAAGMLLLIAFSAESITFESRYQEIISRVREYINKIRANSIFSGIYLVDSSRSVCHKMTEISRNNSCVH